MKVLVTGGGGFIGLALVRRLIKMGLEVSTFSRSIHADHKNLGVKIYAGNLADYEVIEKACSGIEAVFHVAGKVGIWGSYNEFYQTNVVGTENLIRACLKTGVKKLVFTSSASVIFDGSNLEGVDESIEYPVRPVSNYTATKAIAEQLILNANSNQLKTVSLRPHVVWGPGDTHLIPGILQRAKSGKLRKIGTKSFLIDTTFIDNLIDAEILALQSLDSNSKVCGKPFFITNNEPIEIWKFINSILQTADIKPIQKAISKNYALIATCLLEKYHNTFHLKNEPYITRFVIQELCSHHWFNISAAKTMLGYKPKTSFNDGMLILRNFFKEKRN